MEPRSKTCSSAYRELLDPPLRAGGLAVPHGQRHQPCPHPAEPPEAALGLGDKERTRLRLESPTLEPQVPRDKHPPRLTDGETEARRDANQTRSRGMDASSPSFFTIFFFSLTALASSMRKALIVFLVTAAESLGHESVTCPIPGTERRHVPARGGRAGSPARHGAARLSAPTRQAG